MGERTSRIAAGAVAGAATGTVGVVLLWVVVVIRVATGSDRSALSPPAALVPSTMAAGPAVLVVATLLGTLLGLVAAAGADLRRAPRTVRIVGVVAFGVIALLGWAYLGEVVPGSYLLFEFPDPLVLDTVAAVVAGVVGTATAVLAAIRPRVVIGRLGGRSWRIVVATTLLGALVGVGALAFERVFSAWEFDTEYMLSVGDGAVLAVTHEWLWLALCGATLGFLVGFVGCATGRPRWTVPVFAAIAAAAAEFVALQTGIRDPDSSLLGSAWFLGGAGFGSFTTTVRPATVGVTTLVAVLWGVVAGACGVLAVVRLRRPRTEG